MRLLQPVFHSVFCFLIVALSPSLTVAAHTIDDTKSATTKPSESIVADWLAQGERQDFPWQLTISQPLLLYDQASHVGVTAKLSVADLRKKGLYHDLHFIVMVADEAGRWVDGSDYRHQFVDNKIPNQLELQFGLRMSFRPGEFRIAAILYDATLDRRNVMFKRVAVHAPGREPFPELFSQLPRVNFEGGTRVPTFLVSTHRPIQMDLVIEFSSHYVYKGRLHRLIHAPRIFGPAEVLSRLNFENGCVRVTGFDSLKLRTVIPLQPARAVDWQAVRTNIAAEDSHERTQITAAELGAQPSLEAANYFRAELEKLLAAEPSRCSTTSAQPLHVVVILTGGIDFVKGTVRPEIESQCHCTIFYLRTLPPFQSVFNDNVLDLPRADRPLNNRPSGIADASRSSQDPLSRDLSNHSVLRPKDENVVDGDHLKSIVEPLSPKVFEFDSALQFRRKFFDFIAALKNLSDTTTKNGNSTQINCSSRL